MKVKSNKYTGVYIYHSKMRAGEECYYINYRAKGKSINEKVGWKSEGYTQEEASVIRADRIHAVRHGEELPGRSKDDSTFGGSFYSYMGTKTEGFSGDTKRAVQRYLKYLAPLFGEKMLDQITPKMIRDLTTHLLNEGLRDGSIYQYHGLIRRTFDHMIKEMGYKGENPMRMIKTPVPKEHRERYLTKEEASDLLGAMTVVDVELYLFTLIGLLTGMRKSEIMEIKSRDIDMDLGLIRVDGKGGKIRYCEMSETLANILAGRKATGSDLLFKKNFNQVWWQMVVDGRGLNDGVESHDRIWRVTPHTLRHTFGSWLAQAGLDLMVIKELMGDSHIQTTMRYAKLQRRPGVSAVANLTEGVTI